MKIFIWKLQKAIQEQRNRKHLAFLRKEDLELIKKKPKARVINREDEDKNTQKKSKKDNKKS